MRRQCQVLVDLVLWVGYCCKEVTNFCGLLDLAVGNGQREVRFYSGAVSGHLRLSYEEAQNSEKVSSGW